VSDSWRPVAGDRLRWVPQFVEPSSETRQTYISGSHAVVVYVAYYGAGDRGAKLASSSNELLNTGWLPVRATTRPILVGGQTFEAHETVAQAASGSLVVWNWYWVDGTFTGRDAVAKLLLARSRLFRTGHDAVAIAVATQDVPGSDASLILRQFVAGLRVDSLGTPPQS